MNYQKHYHLLIEKRKKDPLSLEEYSEWHHIIPKCIGGSDEPENLIRLTPEEHYVAHQLLVKIYPDEPKLVYATNMLTVNRSDCYRNNKLYGWIKRKLSKTISENQSGNGNSQYDTMWITNGSENKKIKKSDPIPEGWYKGRTFLSSYKPKLIIHCKCCNKRIETNRSNQKYCSLSCSSKLRKYKHDEKSKQKMSIAAKNRPNNSRGTIWITDGFNSKRISTNKNIPNGWIKGRA
jgi:hypothetical protein